MQYGTIQECVSTDAFRFLYQFFYSVDAASHLIHTGTIYSSFHFHHIGKTGQHGIYEYRVAIHYLEQVEIELFYIIYLMFTSALTNQTDIF